MPATAGRRPAAASLLLLELSEVLPDSAPEGVMRAPLLTRGAGPVESGRVHGARAHRGGQARPTTDGDDDEHGPPARTRVAPTCPPAPARAAGPRAAPSR